MDDIHLYMLMSNLHIQLYTTIVYLQSLEFSLRLFLSKKNNENSSDILTVSEGDEVDESILTNYDTLGELIDKYNAVASNKLDKDSQLYIRDGIAHGRLISSYPKPPFELYKYSKPKEGKVKVTHAITLNKLWFKEKNRFILKQLKKIYNESTELNFDIFPDPLPDFMQKM